MDINYISRFYSSEQINVTDMESLVKQVYKDLEKSGDSDTMKDWVLSEALHYSDKHTEFANQFLLTAFRLFDESDWTKLNL